MIGMSWGDVFKNLVLIYGFTIAVMWAAVLIHNLGKKEK